MANRIENDSIFKHNLKSISNSIKSGNPFVKDTLFSNEIYLKILTHQEALKLRERKKSTLKTNFYISISNIKYSGELALLTYSYYCGGRCAGSDVLIFESVDRKWRILTKINLWIA